MTEITLNEMHEAETITNAGGRPLRVCITQKLNVKPRDALRLCVCVCQRPALVASLHRKL